MTLVQRKFSARNPELLRRLLDTGDLTLIEGNHWGDTFWGVDIRTGKGDNHLGMILMQVREQRRHEA